MSAIYSFYRAADGVFTGQRYAGQLADLPANTPPGCRPWPGAVDHLRHRLDLVTQSLLSYQPPPPADTPDCTWAWSPDAWAWTPVPTAKALADQARQQRDALLAATDWRVMRAMEQAAPLPAAWAAYRQALRDITQQPGWPTSIQWPEEPTA